MVRALAALPLAIKLLVVLFLVADFVVITQWSNLPFGGAAHPSIIKKKAAPTKPSKPKPSDLATAKSAVSDKQFAAAAKQHLLKRMGPIVLSDPLVQADGAIHNKNYRLYLYGIKPFNSKNVCTRSTGERWACGLEAYATLHNEVAHQKVICTPEEISVNGIGATCRMNGTNIALVLIRKGLAALDGKASDLALLLNAQDAAKKQKLGIWDR